MQGRLTIIRAADGQCVVFDLNRPVTLEEMQKAVGGHIEEVPSFEKFHDRPCIAFCNEEGKLDGLPVNIAATKAWRDQSGPHDDFLAGDVCIVSGDAEFMSEL